MKVIKRLFLFYLNGSVHVALSISALTVITLLEFDLPIDHNLLLFIFFASVSGYNFVKYAGVAPNHHLSQTPDIGLIRWFTLHCLAAVVWFTFSLSWPTVIASAVLALVTALYAIPAIQKTNLRQVQGLKIFVIAWVWAGATVWLPAIESGTFTFSSTELWLPFIQRFLFVIALTLPFEIRDLKYDEPELATLPQILGIAGTKMLGFVLLALVLGIHFLRSGTISLLPVLITVIVTALVEAASRVHQPAYFSSFWVEGIPVLWLILSLWQL